MPATAHKLLAMRDRRERLQLGLLFLAMLGAAFLEVHANPWLARTYEALGFETATGFLIALGLTALVALALSNTWMAATHWAQYRFTFARSHSLAVRLMRGYAARPYAFFLGRNSADLGKNVLNEAELVTRNLMLPALRLATKTVIACAIVALLVVFDPLLALLVALVLGGLYGLVFLAVRRRLARLGRERVAANTERFKAAVELFGAIKDLKLLGRETAFTGGFTAPSARFNRHRATAMIVGELPRCALEHGDHLLQPVTERQLRHRDEQHAAEGDTMGPSLFQQIAIHEDQSTAP